MRLCCGCLRSYLEQPAAPAAEAVDLVLTVLRGVRSDFPAGTFAKYIHHLFPLLAGTGGCAPAASGRRAAAPPRPAAGGVRATDAHDDVRSPPLFGRPADLVSDDKSTPEMLRLVSGSLRERVAPLLPESGAAL